MIKNIFSILFFLIVSSFIFFVVSNYLSVNNKKKIEISNNPKCLLVQKNGEKISRNERCEATEKKFKNCCGSL